MEKVLFLGCGPALHDVETTRRCIVASLRPEMFDAAGRAACRGFLCGLWRVGWRVGDFCVACGVSGGVSGLSVWLVVGRAERVGLALVACRVGTCDVSGGVSNFVESWIFLSICEKSQ